MKTRFCLVDSDADHALKLAGEKSMAAETDQQLGFLIEDLHAILHPVDHPDVVIAVDGDAFGPRRSIPARRRLCRRC